MLIFFIPAPIFPSLQRHIPAIFPNSTAHAGTPYRDSENETYSATIKCHDPNGELYMVTFSRDSVGLTTYSDDSIRTKVETWADTVPALA